MARVQARLRCCLSMFQNLEKSTSWLSCVWPGMSDSTEKRQHQHRAQHDREHVHPVSAVDLDMRRMLQTVLSGTMSSPGRESATMHIT